MPSSGPPTQYSIIEKPRFGDNSRFPKHKARLAARTDTLMFSAANLPAKPIFAQSASSAARSSTSEHAVSSSHPPNASSNLPSPVVYTDPVTDISITRQDLFAYGQGKRTNEQGDIVFFRPSFLDVDPWKAVRNKR